MALINQTQNKLHHLSLFLAAFSNSYLPKEDDDSQSNIGWLQDNISIASRSVKDVHLEFNFKDLHLSIISKDSKYELDILGLQKSAIDAWIRDHIEKTGLDHKAFNYNLGFELDTPSEIFLDLDKDVEESILKLIDHRNWSQTALESITNKKGINATEIRIWPHHFDTGMLIDLSEKKDLKTGLGLGYAIADATVSEIPYFYVYGWGDKSIDYTSLKDLQHGHWASENWKGALLPVNTTINAKIVEDFYQEASSVLTNKLV